MTDAQVSEALRASSRSRIGNDVMDLRHPRCRDRHRDDPLLDRILSSGERDWLDAAATAELWSIRLWALWAAKETAFKVHSKLSALGPFLPRRFSCQLETDIPSNGTGVRIWGTIRRSDSEMPVTIEGGANRNYVHVVGWSGAVGRPSGSRLEVGLEELKEVDLEDSEEKLEALKSRFSAAEWKGIYSLHSARARLLARDWIRAQLSSSGPGNRLGSRGEGIEIRTAGDRPGQGPPQIWFGGREIGNLDFSLSHHGRFVAWALFLPESEWWAMGT